MKHKMKEQTFSNGTCRHFPFRLDSLGYPLTISPADTLVRRARERVGGVKHGEQLH